MQRALADLARELEVRGLAQEVVEHALAREQFLPLFTKTMREAQEAATQERRILLARVAAGLIEFDEAAEMQSRVVRAVVQLEPSDLHALCGWIDTRDRAEYGLELPQRGQRIDKGDEGTIKLLVDTGCLRETDGDWEKALGDLQLPNHRFRLPHKKVQISRLGRNVVRYIVARPAPET